MQPTNSCNRKVVASEESFASIVGRGLRRSAAVARKVARTHGTPIYVWKNGRVVALRRRPAERILSGLFELASTE